MASADTPVQPKKSKLWYGGTGSRHHSAFEQEIMAKLEAENLTKEQICDKADYANREAVRSRLMRQVRNDIYPIPEISDEQRREECRFDLIKFAETYHKQRFYLAWSKPHYLVMERLQAGILEKAGDKQAIALPRGGGKTMMTETAAEWGILYGHLRYVLLVLASKARAGERLASMKTSLLTNDLLFADFPEVCYPIRMSGGVSQRTKNQHMQGTPTNILWAADKIAMPTLPESRASGSVIQCTSITSSIRGLNHTNDNGESIRPDYIILDDVQNDKQAKNVIRIAEIENRINGVIRGLSGPGIRLTMIMPCTVICKDDVAERYLDREKRPEWQGIRTKLLESFPTDMQLWNEYYSIRQSSFRNGTKGIEGTEFYLEHREAMDAGAVATWNERYDSGGERPEVSAIQHAMNLYFDDPIAFMSEFQNEPRADYQEAKPRFDLTSKALLERISGYARGTIPASTLYLTGGVDIQMRILYYTVTAWTEDFGGVIVDWGTYPRQSSDYFRADDPPVPFDAIPELKDIGYAPRVFHGLNFLKENVFSRKYIREGSEEEVGISRVGIDANYASSTDAVYAFCKSCEPGETFYPSHGKGLGPDNLPMELWVKRMGDVHGKNWIRRKNTRVGNRGRHVIFDTNYWKSIVAERLLSPLGSHNMLTIWGNQTEKPSYQSLRLLCDQLASEQMKAKQGRGREIDQWTQKVGTENHYFDCLIISAVAASTLGMNPHDIMIGQTSASIPVHQRKKAAPFPAQLVTTE